jgi:hypothetical protein
LPRLRFAVVMIRPAMGGAWNNAPVWSFFMVHLVLKVQRTLRKRRAAFTIGARNRLEQTERDSGAARLHSVAVGLRVGQRVGFPACHPGFTIDRVSGDRAGAIPRSGHVALHVVRG